MLLTIRGFEALAAVSMKSALKYRRNWDKNGPTVKLLRKFMPAGSKGFRVYLPIGSTRHNVVAPVVVRSAVKAAGYRITDYLAKKCVKINDKEQKNVFNIGKVIAKDPVAKAAFDNDPQLQNSKAAEFTMVISCHPYDIIGMSTGRDWDQTSCMRLSDDRQGYTDGINKHYLHNDVAEGTLVAYAVRTADTNIQKPLGRCLLKPFVLQGDIPEGFDSKPVKYRRETDVYGNPVPGFTNTLAAFVRQLNKGIPSGFYVMSAKLYDDGVGENDEHNSNEGSGINWAVVDDVQTVRENPMALVSFAQYMISRGHAAEDRWIALNTVANLAESAKVPDRYIKQAARVFVQNPFHITETISHILDRDGVLPEALPKFMLNKDFRKIAQKAATDSYKAGLASDNEEEVRRTNGNVHRYAYFSPLAAKDFVKQEVEGNMSSLYGLARQLIVENLSLPVSYVKQHPQLHKYLLLMADLLRGSTMYGESKQVHRAEMLLAQLERIDTSLSDNEFEEFVQHIVGDMEDGMQYLAFCYAVRCFDAKQIDRTKEIFHECLSPQWQQILFNRRTAKRMQKMNIPEINSDARAHLTVMGTRFKYMPGDTKHSYIAYLRENGLETENVETWVEIAEVPQLFPYVWCKVNREIEESDQVFELAIALTGRHTDFARIANGIDNLKARNEDQQFIFDMLFTYMTFAKRNPKPFGTFREDCLEYFSKIVWHRGAAIDVKTYPILMSRSSSKNILFHDFYGSDVGHSYLSVMEKKLTLQYMLEALSEILNRASEPENIIMGFDHDFDFDEEPFVTVQDTYSAYRAKDLMKYLDAYKRHFTEFVQTFPRLPGFDSDPADDENAALRNMQEWNEYFEGNYPQSDFIKLADKLETFDSRLDNWRLRVDQEANRLMRAATRAIGDN